MMKDHEITLKRRIGTIAVTVMAAFGLVIAITTALTLPLRDPVYLLGPGLYPFSLGIFLFIACVVVLLETRAGSHDHINVRTLVDRVAMKKPVGLLVLLGGSLLLLPIFGYVLSLFLFSFIELTFLEKEKRKWWINMIFASAVTGGVYALFSALTMALPQPFWF